MAKRKTAGRPAGDQKYPDQMFLDILDATDFPMNTDEVAKALQEESGQPVNWNTAKKYLTRLRDEKRINHRKSGLQDMWMKKK